MTASEHLERYLEAPLSGIARYVIDSAVQSFGTTMENDIEDYAAKAGKENYDAQQNRRESRTQRWTATSMDEYHEEQQAKLQDFLRG